MHVGITRMHFPPEKSDDVAKDIRDRIVPYHENMRKSGLHDAIFVLNRETGEAIGIAVWEDEKKLKEVEGSHGRDKPKEVRDPQRAPTDYSKLRAKAIQDVGGAIADSDWYEVVGRV
jgi:hypothetical protein